MDGRSTAHGWWFESRDTCPRCQEVHDQAFHVATGRQPWARPRLYAPCGSKAVDVYEQTRRVDVGALWMTEEGGGTGGGFGRALASIVAAEGWDAKVAAATHALDVAAGKEYAVKDEGGGLSGKATEATRSGGPRVCG